MARASLVSTICRVFCGVVFVVHGTPKLFNLEGTSMFFADVGVPAWMSVPVAFLEFFGGLLLIAGFLTRVWAALFTGEMLGAALVVHRTAGWDVFGGGYEYNIAIIVLLTTVLLLGPGPLAVDRFVGRRSSAEPASSPIDGAPDE